MFLSCIHSYNYGELWADAHSYGYLTDMNWMFFTRILSIKSLFEFLCHFTALAHQAKHLRKECRVHDGNSVFAQKRTNCALAIVIHIHVVIISASVGSHKLCCSPLFEPALLVRCENFIVI